MWDEIGHDDESGARRAKTDDFNNEGLSAAVEKDGRDKMGLNPSILQPVQSLALSARAKPLILQLCSTVSCKTIPFGGNIDVISLRGAPA
jgi:hypothetical protein